MIGSLFPYVNLRRFLTGRRLFILRQMLASLYMTPAIAELVEAAIAHDRKTLDLEYLWKQQKADTSTNRGDAVAIDLEIDQVIGAMESNVRSQIIGSPKDPVRVAAELVVKDAFPLGSKALTQQAFEEQLASVETLLKRFDGNLQEPAKLLGLGRYLQQLQPLARQFGDELRKRKSVVVRWNDVTAAQAEGQEMLAEVVAVIIGTFHRRDAETTGRRESLLAELNRQDALVRESIRRSRRVLDVDPDTGDEVDTELPVAA